MSATCQVCCQHNMLLVLMVMLQRLIFLALLVLYISASGRIVMVVVVVMDLVHCATYPPTRQRSQTAWFSSWRSRGSNRCWWSPFKMMIIRTKTMMMVMTMTMVMVMMKGSRPRPLSKYCSAHKQTFKIFKVKILMRKMDVSLTNPVKSYDDIYIYIYLNMLL